jgi:hypothetical protein
MQRHPGFVKEPSDRGARGLAEDPERLLLGGDHAELDA